MRQLKVLVGAIALPAALLVLGCDATPAGLEDGLTVSAAHNSIDGSNATSINGGGHIRDGDFDVSFAGEVEDLGSSFDGDWVIQFHSVSNADVSGGTFEATSVEAMNFFDGDDESCDAAMNMTLQGTFNGESGWSVIFRAGDAGHTTDHDLDDTARVELSHSGSKVYDTHGGDFTDESNCVGTARTGLDAGNLKIK
jgi:hypothetical protein